MDHAFVGANRSELLQHPQVRRGIDLLAFEQSEFFDLEIQCHSKRMSRITAAIVSTNPAGVILIAFRTGHFG